MANQCHDQVLQHLCEELTATETIYPGTDLRLIYQPVGATVIPRSQVVCMRSNGKLGLHRFDNSVPPKFLGDVALP